MQPSRSIEKKTGSNFHSSSCKPLKVSQNLPLSGKNRGEDLREPAVDIQNREEVKGTLKRKTRGEILCKRIHGRTLEEQE